ncbi:threonine--tRNA ligase [Caldivirga sp. UBA161]|uniref:threonine--tRNA ligase n=1 Tax=Caldivirga sp. UBA161 TaxID=1915569 RepID=UPI0025C1D6DC|nr:threonine--tRNA ligase [Caldivirga sp. UBA161]
MRLLLIHAGSFSFEVRDKAVENPEPLTEELKRGSAENTLVVFTTVEENDNDSPSFLERVANDVLDVAGRVKASSVFLYPYAHLSPNLAPPPRAIAILNALYETLKGKASIPVYKAPFGWYKAFTVSCLGHPLSELSRTITPQEPAPQRKPYTRDYYVIVSPNGSVHDPANYSFSEGDADLKVLVDKEVFKRELEGKEQPRYIDYCVKFGFEWEPLSDVGHMRYGPYATVMIELLDDYSYQVAKSLGIPVFKVKGTNMFRLSDKAISEHAGLFGERMYVTESDEELVMRYAACFQQFAMIKDWVLSYRNLPLGMLEVADSYRYEQPGETVLCFRLRRFYMPDLHIFVKDLKEAMDVGLKLHAKIFEEIRKIGRDYVSLYNVSKEFFDQNKDYLVELARREGKPILVRILEGAKYYWVLNVEYHIIDELRRPREIATFQFDIGNAQRFGIKYRDENNNIKYPVIIHTAILGSIERYVFALLDTAAINEANGKVPVLPTWIAPVQVRVIPVSSSYNEGAVELARRIEEAGFRVEVDDRDETVSRKIRDAETLWIPYIVVFGEREAKTGSLSVRVRGVGQVSMRIEELLSRLDAETKGYPRKPLTAPMLLSIRPPLP